MTKILMIGTFLSKKTGTLSISEKIATDFKNTEIFLRLVSKKRNKLLRIFEIVLCSLILAYDKMHIDTFSGQAFMITELAATIGKLRRKKVIMTLHGGMLPDFYEKSPARVKRTLAKADYLQTPSLYLKDFFAKQEVQLNYLPNSINLSKFTYSRKDFKPHSLLWVRAFTEIYNPDLAIKTLNEVRKTYPDTTLTMIGPDKGSLSKMKTLINDLLLGSTVDITGPIPNDQLYLYYQTHEVYLNTTSYESFGVAVLEAAACGIPVISTSVGEVPYIWKNNEDILLVEGFHYEEFAKAVIKLFNSKRLADSISTRARKKAEQFDRKKILSLWRDLLS